jgi:hypothetical protein
MKNVIQISVNVYVLLNFKDSGLTLKTLLYEGANGMKPLVAENITTVHM